VKIKIICIGKTKRGFLAQGIDEYLQRLKHYTTLEWIEIQSSVKSRSSSYEEAMSEEGKRIRTHIHAPAIMVALTEKGKEYTTKDFAGWLESEMIKGRREIGFVIGGDQGLEPSVISDAQICLSLSRMTFTHQMARLILLEQLYRAFTIIRGEPYHHG